MRDARIDFIKGVAISLVVIGHMPQVGSMAATLTAVHNWIYAFHMPIFCFVTGWLFGLKAGTFEEAQKVLDRMFKPYLVAGVMMLSMYAVAHRLGAVMTGTGGCSSVIDAGAKLLSGRCGGALWYLYVFGFAELFVLLALAVSRRLGFDKFSFVATVVVVVFLGMSGLDVLGGSTSMPLIPYFVLGFLLRLFVGCLAGSFWFVIPLAVVAYSQPVWVGCRANYILVFSVLAVLVKFAEVCKGRLMWDLMVFLGRHTLVILIFHSMVSVAVRPLSSVILSFERTGIGVWCVLVPLIIVVCLVIEWAVKKTPARLLLF